MAFWVSGLALAFPSGSSALMAGSLHDFTGAGGFTGGGLCAECHVPHKAGDVRLWPRPAPGTSAPDKLCANCHDNTGRALSAIFSTEPGWSGVSAVPPDIPSPHFTDCSDCHNHATGFLVPNSDCLSASCHGSGAARPELRIDDRFSLAEGSNTTILSQHSVLYTSDGNFSTIETPAQNECKKCHGVGDAHRYVTTGQWLIYPDDPDGGGGIGQGDPITHSTDYSTYQAFCISCHDGQDAAPANAAFLQLNGAIPSHQRAPSCPGNPALRQDNGSCSGSGVPWDVPAAPTKDVNNSPSYVTPTPYFAYYEINGHGRATDRQGNPMNVNCLGGGTVGQGCHSPHGAENRFLLYDEAVIFGPGIDTAGEVAESVCVSCHIPDVTMAGFHSFAEHNDAAVRHLALMTANPNLTVGVGTTSGVLPFYANPSAPIENRLYSAPTMGSSHIHCLSCHDPHGTAATYNQYQYGETGTYSPHTQGMLRKYPRYWVADRDGDQKPNSYEDPLCGECHIQ